MSDEQRLAVDRFAAAYRGPVTVLSMRDATNEQPWHLYIAKDAPAVAGMLGDLSTAGFVELPQVTIAYDIDQSGGGTARSTFLDAGTVYVNPDAVATITTYRR